MPFISNKRISKIEQTLETIQQNIGINNSDSSDMQLLENNLKNQSDKVSKRGNLNKIDFQRKKAAYALNLCTVSVSQIIDYADINILDQEYDAILNNINLENMPKDEALLNIFERILDTITFFRIQEGQKELLESEYKQKMKNAIWSAVPNIGLLVAGGNFFTMAISLASQVGIGYMNYRRTKANNDLEYKRKQWEMESNAIEQFNGIRRELFNTAWHLCDNYGIPENQRLTEKQINEYNRILMDPDNVRKFQRLCTISENFDAYPPFWYYLGSTANSIAQEYLDKLKEIDNLEDNDSTQNEAVETIKNIFEKYKSIAITSFNKFFYENGDSEEENNLKLKTKNEFALLREDLIASSCAMEYAELLDEKQSSDREIIEKLYKLAERYAPDENDVLQLCGMGYLRIGKSEETERLLLNLINKDYNRIVNTQILSRLKVYRYIEEKDARIKSDLKNEYELLASRINNNYIYPWSENKNELEMNNNNYVNKQKAILAKKIFIILTEMRKRYMIAYNKIIPVPYPLNYYAEEYFYDFDKNNEERKNNVLKILTNPKDSLKYAESLRVVDFSFKVFELMEKLLEELKGLATPDNDQYQLIDNNSFDELVSSIAETINQNKDTLYKSTQFNKGLPDLITENNNSKKKDDKGTNSKNKEEAFDNEIKKSLENIFSITFDKITKPMFEMLLSNVYEKLNEFKTMEEISKTDDYFYNWAKSLEITIPEDIFYLEKSQEEKKSILTIDILGNKYQKNVVNREDMENCKKLISQEKVSKNEKRLCLYKEGELEFGNYIIKMKKKDKANLGKEELNEIFAILNDKLPLVDTDLLFGLNKVYLVHAFGIQVAAEYKDITWQDANQTRIQIGKANNKFTYSNKNANLKELMDLIKQYAESREKQIKPVKQSLKIEEEKYNKLFSYLDEKRNTIGDSLKLMLADKASIFQK